MVYQHIMPCCVVHFQCWCTARKGSADTSGASAPYCCCSDQTNTLPLQMADFGLSRVLSQEAISMGIFGTVMYMPPEHADDINVCPCRWPTLG